jgi:hypothetical protein
MVAWTGVPRRWGGSLSDLEVRLERLEAAVEAVVRHLEAGAQVIVSGLAGLPVLDTQREHREAPDDQPRQVNGRT